LTGSLEPVGRMIYQATDGVGTDRTFPLKTSPRMRAKTVDPGG
jgi:hypothetical protein